MQNLSTKIIASVVVVFAIFALLLSIRDPKTNTIPTTNETKQQITQTPVQDGEELIPNVETTKQHVNYVEYSDKTVQTFLQEGKKVVLFFHAPWCPTCKSFDKELSENLNQLPEDVVVVKTDYDTNTELKKQYGVTYQHTFVQLDQDKNSLNKWSGGNLKSFLANIK
ncbi:thioredoxin family protein [candidate division WWE3 bacterium]|uniref:Thioredoxin family protein n=1 Tax=candidate division WWE3 bacterium TaxID=2053526 RepID=A0A955EAH2_UNCKA|nr:thioredoxin family protein [candidate division WWE3 bacterium]